VIWCQTSRFTALYSTMFLRVGFDIQSRIVGHMRERGRYTHTHSLSLCMCVFVCVYVCAWVCVAVDGHVLGVVDEESCCRPSTGKSTESIKRKAFG
jgi:hypothetical protein